MSRHAGMRRALMLLAALTLAGQGCGSAQTPAATPAAAASDSVQIGCSGGNTGLGVGNTLTRDGQLTSYHRPLREAATHTPLRRDSAAAAEVFAELDRMRFRTFRFSEIGNMTCYLELTDDAGKHEVDWVMGQPPAELAPALAVLRRTFGDERQMWP